MVTQFSFAPARVIEYCTRMARERPMLPVYVGLAGPTEPRTLLRFAQRCGVSASLRALKDQGMAAVRLVTHTDPGEQLAASPATASDTRRATWWACTCSASAAPRRPRSGCAVVAGCAVPSHLKAPRLNRRDAEVDSGVAMHSRASLQTPRTL